MLKAEQENNKSSIESSPAESPSPAAGSVPNIVTPPSVDINVNEPKSDNAKSEDKETRDSTETTSLNSQAGGVPGVQDRKSNKKFFKGLIPRKRTTKRAMASPRSSASSDRTSELTLSSATTTGAQILSPSSSPSSVLTKSTTIGELTANASENKHEGDKPGDTSVAAPTPLIFRTEEFHSVIESAEVESSTRQKATSFITRSYHWAANDLADFRKAIQGIRENVTDLENNLSYRQPADIDLATALANTEVLSQHEKARGAILRLHHALAARNQNKRPVEISMKLMDDHKFYHRAMAQYLGLRSDSFLFLLPLLQVQDSNDTRYIHVAVETAESSGPSHIDHWTEILDLGGKLREVQIPDNADPEWSLLGYISALATPSDAHRLFYYRPGPLYLQCSLEDILEIQQFKNLSEEKRIKLAMLSAIVYFDFSEILQSLPAPIVKPSNIQFYHKTTPVRENLDLITFISAPYLSVGMGRRSTMVDIGLEDGITERPNSPIVELGLLLFQIACGVKLDYGTGIEGLREARDIALRRASEVDRKFGASYSELVEYCLSFDDDDGSYQFYNPELNDRIIKAAYKKLGEVLKHFKGPA